MTYQTTTFALLLVVLGTSGCQKQDSSSIPVIPLQIESSHSQVSPVTNSKILVPPDVARKWKTVRIAVVDKTSVTQKVYTIPVGGRFKVPSSEMTVEVEVFLPAFIMEGSVLTSSSNELTNPAAKIKITENGAAIFKGWLFAKFPNTHAFMNPKYGFTLVDEGLHGK